MAAEIVIFNEIIDASIDEEFSQLLDYEEDGEFHLISASAAFMKRELKRIAGFCEVVVPSYAIAEFRSHFRMTKTTFEVLCTLENRTLSSSHVDASHVTQIKNGVWPGTGFEWQMVSTFSVREFWTTFQEIPFSRKNFRSGRQNSSFHLHSIRNFRIFWVNGKQP